MSERCPLLDATYEGLVIPAWDTNMPKPCQECFNKAYADPAITKVGASLVIDEATAEWAAEHSDRWSAMGVRVLSTRDNTQSLREGTLESGIDIKGDNESDCTDRTTFLFNCRIY